MTCVILAGGKGTRLWPISRESCPKQFLKLCSEKHTMLQETVMRHRPFADDFLIITGEVFESVVHQQMRELEGVCYKVLLEPLGRNTAPAIATAALLADKTDLLFVVPADAKIQADVNYTNAVLKAKELAQKGNIVTFGIQPKSAHTGYGYIKYSRYKVEEFKEKPDAITAQKYLQAGNYLWNSGMFLFQAKTLLEELEKARKDIFDACAMVMDSVVYHKNTITLSTEKWSNIPSESIDYAVMEHSDKIAVVPSNFLWDDIGGLEALAQYWDKQDKKVILHQSNGTEVLNQSNNIMVVTAGVEDLLVVATDDVVYICPKGKSTLNIEILKQLK